MLSHLSFFDISSFSHKEVFNNCMHVWDALKNLKPHMDALPYDNLQVNDLINDGIPLTETVIVVDNAVIDGRETIIKFGDATKGKLQVFRNSQLLEGASVIMSGAVLMGNQISIGKGTLIESGAMIKSPTVIGDFCEVRQGAYIRGYCLTGQNCVLGHVTEVKHSIFLNDAKAGHFAYIGDSILGNQVNLGAGTKLANLRFTEGQVAVKVQDKLVKTNLRKFGDILGDKVQTGCNSVTNPGTILGKKSFVLPNTTVPSGYHCDSTLVR